MDGSLKGGAKIFFSLLLCILGLNYLVLFGLIYTESAFKIPAIIEAYGAFEFSEIVDHTSRFLSWFLLTFTIVTSVFFTTSYSNKLKSFFAFLVPIFIVSDIGSMWLIKYSGLFAYQLFLSGAVLAVTFLAMFLLIQYDFWIKKK